SDTDYSVPYFFTNFNTSNNTSYGAIIPAPFTSAGNTNDNVLSGMIQSYHVIGASEGSGYWTMMNSNFHPNFTFAKNADATVKVNAVLVKPGAGAFDFGIAMGVFVNDKLIGTKVYPFSSLNQLTYCARKKITLLAPVNIIGGTNNVVKIGFRVVGSNQFEYTSPGGTTPSDGSLHSSLKSARIYVGTAFTNSTGPNGTYCENTAFQSPVNITVYGVSSN
ncbi:hypothetical protein, partial [Algoriella sp.]|uniref:hypothetical protein n=1 Tax=Algoriella sp. TaxID=1872434 RepID=UPI001B07FD67